MKNSAGGISVDENVSKHLAECNQPLTSEWFCPPGKSEMRDSNNSSVIKKCIYKKKKKTLSRYSGKLHFIYQYNSDGEKISILDCVRR